MIDHVLLSFITRVVGKEINVRLAIMNQRILVHECSFFIKFIKLVKEKDKTRGLPSILSIFPNKFVK